MMWSIGVYLIWSRYDETIVCLCMQRAYQENSGAVRWFYVLLLPVSELCQGGISVETGTGLDGLFQNPSVHVRRGLDPCMGGGDLSTSIRRVITYIGFRDIDKKCTEVRTLATQL